jgi:hypothetical protein
MEVSLLTGLLHLMDSRKMFTLIEGLLRAGIVHSVRLLNEPRYQFLISIKLEKSSQATHFNASNPKLSLFQQQHFFHARKIACGNAIEV